MNKYYGVSLLAGVALVAFGTTAASAQQATDEAGDEGFSLSEIIVTAQKREENVQDVPAAISAFGGADLEARGLSTAEDLQFAVPGLVISEVSTAEKANVTLRGVGDLAGGDPTVPIHLDGHYLQFTSFITKDFLDVERVEVQRGPQGTLYGRNAVGGTINVITKRPTEDFDLGLTLDLGNYDKRRIQGYISGPLSDKLRVRLAVGDERRDGYVKNLFNNQDMLTSDYTSIRGSLVYEPTEDIEIFINAYHYEDKGQSSVARIWGDYRREPGTFFASPLNPVNVSANDPWVVDTDVPHWNIDKAKGASFDLTWDFGPVIFKSLSGYNNAKKGGVTDFDTTSFAGFKQAYDFGASETYTHELQLLSDTTSPLKFVLGAFYFHEKSREVFELAENGACIIGYDPDACKNYGFADFTLYIADTEKYDSYAVFGQVDYDLTDRLSLSIGARYSHDKRDRVNEFGIDFSSYPLSSPPMLIPLKGTWSEPTGKVSLSYDISDDTLVYASYSRGYKAGGFSGALDPLYKPETLNAYEIGMKGEFLDRRLRVNAAAFYYDYKDKIQDVLTTDPDTGEGIESFTNAAAAEVKGIEVEAVARVTEGLTLNAAVSYQDAIFKDFLTEDPSNAAAGLQDLSGNKLPMAPDWTVHLGAQYRWELNDLGSLTARADFSWVDDQYLRQFNLPTERVDAYHQTHLRLTWESADNRFSVAGYVRNLENENVVTSLVVGAPPLGFQRFVTYLPPRTYGLVLGFKY